MSRFLVIAGLSGAGRSLAADHLEDLGWFVIDNLPPSLMAKVGELAQAQGTSIDRVALVVGPGPYHGEVLDALDDLRAGGSRVRILFLDAATDVLVRRYEATRRRHPLGDADSLAITIERERLVLEPVKAQADVVVDTSELNTHQLKARMVELFGAESPESGMQLSVTSFGYTHGLPLDVDLVVDCRFLPNPHWVDLLRPLTGLDEPVRRYVLEQPITDEFLDRLESLLELLLPAYIAEGKAYLTVAFGCTGGRHRSVAIAEEIADRLRRRGEHPSVSHRDLSR